MKYGLTLLQFSFLDKNVFTKLKNAGAKVFIFGSRARGSQSEFSDVDILVDASVDLSSLIGSIAEEMEESNFPYKVDIVESQRLADSYRASVSKDKILL
ncbi:MAG: nucleotidyltransferase domain-containing protein [Oligoflexus sp.]|nr:nucleotidyltransferase domain-containing protein [Oligoflexus sp.]